MASITASRENVSRRVFGVILALFGLLSSIDSVDLLSLLRWKFENRGRLRPTRVLCRRAIQRILAIVKKE